MTILTGGAGFVGSNLLKRLNAEGETDVLVVDNLKNADKYRNLVGARFSDYIAKADFLDDLDDGAFDDASITAIYHQGACTDTLEYDGEYMMRNNYDYSKAILHFALDRRVPLVYASSGSVYGLSEDSAEREENEWPLNVYGYSKLQFDRYVRRLMPSIETTVVGLRYFNVYGDGEAHKGRMASMVYNFARQIQDTGVARLFGEVDGYGPGESTRDFVYVDDLVEMNLFFGQGGPVQAVVNAGTGASQTWNRVAQAVIDALGRGRIEYIDFPESMRGKYQFHTQAAPTLLRSLGYDRDFVPLSQGVREYFAKAARRDAAFGTRKAVV